MTGESKIVQTQYHKYYPIRPIIPQHKIVTNQHLPNICIDIVGDKNAWVVILDNW
jgi:hypothetical protein